MRVGRAAVLLVMVAGVWLGCSKKQPTTPPVCRISSTSLDFGAIPVGESAERSFTVTNDGGGTLSGSVSAAAACTVFNVVGSGAYSLGAAGSSTFTIRFSPIRLGAYQCAVETGCAQQVQVSGQAIEPAECLVSPTSLDFGYVGIGQSADKTFTVTNTGGGMLSGTVEACPGGQFVIVGSASYSLAPQQSATMTVRYAPTQGGTAECGIRSPGCATVLCRGTGAICQLSVSSLDFGEATYGSRTERTFRVTNLSSSTETFVPTEDCDYFFVRPTSLTLAASASGTFTVTYEALACDEQTCTVHLNRPINQECAQVACRGVTRPAINFGDVAVGREVSQEIIVTYPASTSCPRPNIVADENCPDFLISPIRSSLFGDSVTYRVSFRPRQVGNQNCTIRMLVLCTPGTAYQVFKYLCLTGNAFVAPGTPVCQLSATTIDFGTVQVGQSVDRTLTVSNVGQGVLSGSLASCYPPFQYLDDPYFGLAAGESKTFRIRFSPTEAGHAYGCYPYASHPYCPLVNLSGESR